MSRRASAAALLSVAASIGCSSTPSATSTPTPSDAGADAPPWLGDAGLVARAPVQRPLASLCGIASNPGDMPLGDDPLSAGKRAGYFQAANDLGAAMIRRDFSWVEIEPSNGQFSFASYDALVMQAQAAGVRLLATLDTTPTWAALDPDASTGLGGESAPRSASDYAAFAGALATHFAGKLAGWEIWNEESNGFRFWQPTFGGDPAAYGDLLSQAHDAIHAVDPSTPVLFGGCPFDPQLIPGTIAFESSVFAARPGVAQKLDGMGLHPYEAYPPSVAPEQGSRYETPLTDKIEEQAWLLKRVGAAAAPIWITEIGWPVTSDVDEAAQARYLVRATILAAAAGAQAIFWYTLRDGPNPGAFPPEDAFGLLHNDEQLADAGADGGAYGEATPKRSYTALKTLLGTVGARWPSTTPPGVTGLPGDGHAVTFAGASSGVGRVIALWTEGSTARVTLPGLSGNVVDEVGNPVGASAGGVAIGPDVTYVVVP